MLHISTYLKLLSNSGEVSLKLWAVAYSVDAIAIISGRRDLYSLIHKYNLSMN
jgi:hypothetical protein